MDFKKLSNNDLCKQYQKYSEKFSNANWNSKDLSFFNNITQEMINRFLCQWYEDK